MSEYFTEQGGKSIVLSIKAMVTQETSHGRQEVGIITSLRRVEKAEQDSCSDLLPLL